MRRTYWYHEECLVAVETATRTSKSPHHEICARCGYEGLCMEAELVTNPDVRLIKVPDTNILIAPRRKDMSEIPPEGELAEEAEAIEEAVKEALEEVTEVIEREEESPEETAPAEAVEPIAEEVAVESPEAVADEFSPPDVYEVQAAAAKLEAAVSDKNADISRLEAELEALKKK